MLKQFYSLHLRGIIVIPVLIPDPETSSPIYAEAVRWIVHSPQTRLPGGESRQVQGFSFRSLPRQRCNILVASEPAVCALAITHVADLP